jgi:hypothetical protein
MFSYRKPCCGFCLKEFSKEKHVLLHISNSRECRAARDREKIREMSKINRRGLGQGVSPLASNSNPSPPNLDHDTIMADGEDELAGPDETVIPSQLGIKLAINHEPELAINHDDATDQSQSHRDPVEDNIVRYAENYNAADVAHVLRKSLSPFQALKEDQNRLGEDPWAPFKSESDWGLAAFLIKEVSQTATDKYLKLPIVSGQRDLIL